MGPRSCGPLPRTTSARADRAIIAARQLLFESHGTPSKAGQSTRAARTLPTLAWCGPVDMHVARETRVWQEALATRNSVARLLSRAHSDALAEQSINCTGSPRLIAVDCLDAGGPCRLFARRFRRSAHVPSHRRKFAFHDRYALIAWTPGSRGTCA